MVGGADWKVEYDVLRSGWPTPALTHQSHAMTRPSTSPVRIRLSEGEKGER